MFSLIKFTCNIFLEIKDCKDIICHFDLVRNQNKKFLNKYIYKPQKIRRNSLSNNAFFWALPQGSGFHTRLPQKSGRAQAIAQSLTRIGVLKRKLFINTCKR
ncbi:hypothetical protein BST83_17075 [Polaribacter filamentus]|uniref:Uncharacterized protein n=1 Tax=Polaribacter filamentus TaxID=53483 RepID=A0A2S7KKA6_9FLAO|nr:hypothetical protein BST83_17075 [Polaribacter filamentus]